jgi:hypothetical protein
VSAVFPLVNLIQYAHFAAIPPAAQSANSAHSPADRHGVAAVAELLKRSAFAACVQVDLERFSITNSEEQPPPAHPPPNRPLYVLQGWGLTASGYLRQQ